MDLRELLLADVPALERLHASMNLDYKLPDARTAFFVKTGMFDGDRLVTAVLGRLTSEAYLLIDGKWATPAERWENVQRLIVASAQQAKLMGIDDVHVWIPPTIEKRFAKRLEDFAFVKAPWNCYTAKL
jgi:hypothetical protein